MKPVLQGWAATVLRHLFDLETNRASVYSRDHSYVGIRLR